MLWRTLRQSSYTSRTALLYTASGKCILTRAMIVRSTTRTPWLWSSPTSRESVSIRYFNTNLQCTSTDMLILYIPLPLLWTVKLPMKTKILCAFWLCSGVFIMVATLLRCILSLRDPSQVNNMTIWSIRETVSFAQ